MHDTALLTAWEPAAEPASQPNLMWWLALSRVSGLGPVRTSQLLETFRSPEAIFGASFSELTDGALRMPATVVRAILGGPDFDWAEDQLERAARHGVEILGFDDPTYPRRLREISSAPPVLFLKGPLARDHFRPVGVVGTRHPSELGRETCWKMVQDWAIQGIRIVSGLAMGIDETAHKAALSVGGETVAVLGNGLDQFGENGRTTLHDRIGEEGLLLSELPMGMVPTPQTFPRRNRIISGLSRAVVVAEAGLGSGALITARDCLDQNRELLVVPGPAGWPSFAGNHQLLKRGAGLCSEVGDLNDACGWRPGFAMSLPQEVDESPLVGLLRCESQSAEELALRLERPVGTVLVELSKLEISGRIRRVAGGIFAPV